jgi:hypothetical protein
MKRRDENRVERGAESARQEAEQAAHTKGRIAIGSDGAKVKGAGTKTTFD